MSNSDIFCIRSYREKSDLKAIVRIWREIGWIENESKETQASLQSVLSEANAWITEVNKGVEACVITMPGTMRYLGETLRLCGVLSVTAGMSIRRRGIAGRLTAYSLAKCAERGDQIAMLGYFDQGYYDRLGFGNGTTEREIRFDPSQLTLARRSIPIPVRIGANDWKEIHSARLRGDHGHGSISITNPQSTHTELLLAENGIGFGFRTGKRLTHGMCGELKNEGTRFSIQFLFYDNVDQLFDLLWVIKSLSDQVTTVSIIEPPEINIQDMLAVPLRTWETRVIGDHRLQFNGYSIWQARILDLVGCIRSCPIPGRGNLEFNLTLSDPIDGYLDADNVWRGVAGDYRVTLGEHPNCEPGTDPTLPTLEASVNAVTRMWLGSASAEMLSHCGMLTGTPELLRQLSWLLCLPQPHPFWGI